MRGALIAVCCAVALGLAPGAQAQGRVETLADIRQEMSVLFVELQRLKRELNTTGAPEVGSPAGTALQRIDAIEGALQQLTARAEEMEHRIARIVNDGTTRLGDLEFRLCELEPGCDPATLGETSTLGGGAQPVAPAPATPSAPSAGGAEMAVGEQADFDRAQAAYQAGDFDAAAAQFAAFTETYPGGPLSGVAHFLRGEALSAQGRTSDAARAYLQSFSGDPDGARASEALLQLGVSLGTLGQTQEACVTLSEVATRFPGATVVPEAAAAREALGCP
ncbi:tol-pal system protein YbgF [Rhodovulum iodosum]|uniref:Cell division coordinator CpoB n=1 Tax=Rhodovulum iodosum TaxID=68291 RepID=A0ABV3XWB8_9RHOB|nr:tol-pal system protein YbgF [Rhodovulum robiginosum]